MVLSGSLACFFFASVLRIFTLQGAVSGCCQALTHTSHTYDTIKRRPAGLYYTYSQPLLLHGVITPAAAAAWGAQMAAQAQAAAAAQTAAATPTQTP